MSVTPRAVEIDQDLRGARDDGNLETSRTTEISSSALVEPLASEEESSEAAAAEATAVYEDVVSEQLAEDERRLQERQLQRERDEAAEAEAASAPRRGRVGMLQQAFEAFLRHHQGNNRIDASQLQSVLQEAGLEMDADQAAAILKAANVSATGDLDFEEFYSIFVGLKIFKHLDQNKTACIQEHDLIRTLENYGLPTDRSMAEKMIQMVGEDEEGYVSFPAFFQIYLDVHHQHHRNIDLLEHAVRHWYSGVSKDTILAQNQNLTPLQDFVAGTLAGVAITLVGHPFDTIKVRLQTQQQAYGSAIQATLKTVREEGIRGLYKGMGSPMATIPLINAIVFAAYGQAKAWLQDPNAPDQDLSIPQLALAGAWAGFVNAGVVTPVELIKIRLQNQYENTAAQFNLNLKERLRSGLRSSLFERRIFYNGPIDCIVQIFKEKGFPGLWKGTSATIYREIPGYMGQFVVYEYIKRYLISRQGPECTVDDLHPLHLMLAGGMSGIGAWIASYPMDYVKSASDTKQYRKNRLLLDGGFFDCWRQMVKERGLPSLWRGFGPCVARAFPANAAGFLGYEVIARLFRDQNAASTSSPSSISTGTGTSSPISASSSITSSSP